MTKKETCAISVCEHWTVNNNCKRCEHDCKYFGLGGCKLEWERCFKITNCYYKQLKDATEQYKIAINSLKKIGIEQYYLPQTVAKETLKRLGEIEDATCF